MVFKGDQLVTSCIWCYFQFMLVSKPIPWLLITHERKFESTIWFLLNEIGYVYLHVEGTNWKFYLSLSFHFLSFVLWLATQFVSIYILCCIQFSIHKRKQKRTTYCLTKLYHICAVVIYTKSVWSMSIQSVFIYLYCLIPEFSVSQY